MRDKRPYVGSLRLDAKLHKALMGAAINHGHSFNYEINLRLAASMGMDIDIDHNKGRRINRMAAHRNGCMKCSRCEKIKPLTDFYRRINGYWQSWCNECLRASAKRYRELSKHAR